MTKNSFHTRSWRQKTKRCSNQNKKRRTHGWHWTNLTNKKRHMHNSTHWKTLYAYYQGSNFYTKRQNHTIKSSQPTTKQNPPWVGWSSKGMISADLGSMQTASTDETCYTPISRGEATTLWTNIAEMHANKQTTIRWHEAKEARATWKDMKHWIALAPWPHGDGAASSIEERDTSCM